MQETAHQIHYLGGKRFKRALKKAKGTHKNREHFLTPTWGDENHHNRWSPPKILPLQVKSGLIWLRVIIFIYFIARDADPDFSGN